MVFHYGLNRQGEEVLAVSSMERITPLIFHSANLLCLFCSGQVQAITNDQIKAMPRHATCRTLFKGFLESFDPRLGWSQT
jgi:hypothetical protein